MGTDYLCELRLKTLSPALHSLFTNMAFLSYSMLEHYTDVFPNFTDHTVTHSLQVINFCNILIGEENIGKLNADELYILLAACYLHDFGMGISKKDFEAMRSRVLPADYDALHPEEPLPETVRKFHNDFSAEMICKYASLFEFPSEEHKWAVAQVARGHRKVDLNDRSEYPLRYPLPNGNTVCLPYLAALIRLADELDLAADRNFDFVSSAVHNIHFDAHRAIRSLVPEEAHFVMTVRPCSQPVLMEVFSVHHKACNMLSELRRMIVEETPFTFRRTGIDLILVSE